MPIRYIIFAFAISILACTEKNSTSNTSNVYPNQNGKQPGQPVTAINTGAATPLEVITYAQTLKGIPYKFGSVNPNQGFDCSGFITYVFNHFNVAVPRSSVDFTNIKHDIPLREAKPGDIILFTGTDSTKKVIGHMGILVTGAAEGITFIHSTSGKANGVTETPLNAYYQGRYMKTIRIFPQNEKW